MKHIQWVLPIVALLGLAMILGEDITAARAEVSKPPQQVIDQIDPDNYDTQWAWQYFVVVEKSTKTWKDEQTGLMIEEYYERRRSPDWWPVSNETLTLCQDQIDQTGQLLYGQMAPDQAVTCVYDADEEVYRSTKAKISETDYVQQKQWNTAHKYCGNDDCLVWGTFYAMFRDQFQWVRTNTKWTIKNWYHKWGCKSECLRCNNTTFVLYYQEGPKQPTWSGNTSIMQTYAYSFKEGKEFGATQETARVDASAYYNGVFKKTLTTVQVWD
ncbi:MAG TPA: hypothetical protein VI776_14120 [Anaerolineales bacterium]|nr:hypothetical protein [Anaerolineales bacterium]